MDYREAIVVEINELYPQMLKLFEKNPQLTLDQVIHVVNDAYSEAQLNTIKPYVPIPVESLDEKNSSYHAEVKHKITSGFQDQNLTSPFIDEDSGIL